MTCREEAGRWLVSCFGLNPCPFLVSILARLLFCFKRCCCTFVYDPSSAQAFVYLGCTWDSDLDRGVVCSREQKQLS